MKLSISIGSKTKSLGVSCFEGCTKLEDVIGQSHLVSKDSMKGDFYEKKVKEEKKKQKIMKIVKIVGWTVGIIALLLLMIGLANQ